jgi:HAD superfamily hydrolase (TIGR01662 family)
MGKSELLARYTLYIFDADETLRRTTVPGQPCPRRQGEWELMPRVKEKLTGVPWNQPGGPFFGIASNQDQVAYGQLSFGMARELLRELAWAAGEIDPSDEALRLCPHALDVECDCRKPGAGMLEDIMQHYGVKPGETLFVGNHETDRAAAARAGSEFMWAAEFFGWDRTRDPHVRQLSQSA